MYTKCVIYELNILNITKPTYNIASLNDYINRELPKFHYKIWGISLRLIFRNFYQLINTAVSANYFTIYFADLTCKKITACLT